MCLKTAHLSVKIHIGSYSVLSRIARCEMRRHPSDGTTKTSPEKTYRHYRMSQQRGQKWYFTH